MPFPSSFHRASIARPPTTAEVRQSLKVPLSSHDSSAPFADNRQIRLHTPTRLGVTFDDDRAVAGAGLALVATLSKQLGTFKLANELIDLGGVPGHATSGTGRPDRTVGLCLPSETGNFFPHRVPHPV